MQLGGYANRVGAHYWNMHLDELSLSEERAREMSIDCNLRHTEDFRGNDNFTPRTITMGYKGSLGALSSDSELAPEFDEGMHECDGWGGNVRVVQQPRIQPSEFYQSAVGGIGWNPHAPTPTAPAPPEEEPPPPIEVFEDKDPAYWTDYCTAQFHEKSHVLLPSTVGYEFSHWVQGAALMKSTVGEDLLERVRWFAEECDSIQGFVLSADMADAFGGCASTASQFLMDDYRRPLLSSPLADIDTDATTAATVTLNRALALHQLAQCSSTVIPVSTAGWQFETLVYDAKRSHHSTAVTAAALHTALLPSRLHGRHHVSIHQQNAMLTRLPSMTVASLELGSPVTVEDKYFNLTHSAQLAELPTVFGELVVQRSLKDYDKRCARSTVVTWEHQAAIPAGFPQLFGPGMSESLSRDQDGSVTSMASTTRTACDRHGGALVTDALDGFRYVRTRNRAAVADLVRAGMEEDELLDIEEALTNVALDYEECG